MTHLWIVLAAGSFAAVVAILAADRLKRRRDEAQAYLKGVRSIVSGDPDAAIAALSDAARLGTPEAVDTYLALGALFRREGDLARAVRLHRNMLLGPDLDPARRPEVERELAEDYRRSGMLAEAAELYEGLEVGEGYFWVLQSNLEDDREYRYGLTDESGKINLNTATSNMLVFLPKMTVELTTAILDWRETNGGTG